MFSTLLGLYGERDWSLSDRGALSARARKLPSLIAGAFFVVLALVRLFALFVVFPALQLFVRKPARVGSR
jgi:hypothetical protein